MSGLRRETIEKRILEAALEHASVDEVARELFGIFGRFDERTREARGRRRELRGKLCRLGRLLAARIEEEEEERQRAEEREDQAERDKWNGL